MFTVRLLSVYDTDEVECEVVNFHRLWYLTPHYFSPVVELCNVYRGAQDKENDVALAARRNIVKACTRTTAATLCRSRTCGKIAHARVLIAALAHECDMERLSRICHFSRKKIEDLSFMISRCCYLFFRYRTNLICTRLAHDCKISRS